MSALSVTYLRSKCLQTSTAESSMTRSIGCFDAYTSTLAFIKGFPKLRNFFFFIHNCSYLRYSKHPCVLGNMNPSIQRWLNAGHVSDHVKANFQRLEQLLKIFFAKWKLPGIFTCFFLFHIWQIQLDSCFDSGFDRSISRTSIFPEICQPCGECGICIDTVIWHSPKPFTQMETEHPNDSCTLICQTG